MTTCPRCDSPLQWYARRNQVTFYSCTACGQRFKRSATSAFQPVRARGTPSPSRPLTDDEVALLLTSFESHRQMEIRLGVGRELIRLIRIGKAYADRCPDLDRWRSFDHRPTCCRCANWRPHPETPSCAFGFPDPIQESTYFARECLHYQPMPPSDCRSSVASTASGSQRLMSPSRCRSTITATTAPNTAATPAAQR